MRLLDKGLKIKKSILFLGLIFSCSYAQTLSLQQSIEKTLLNNPDIKSFILKTEQSKKNSDAVIADSLPQINLQVEYDITQTYGITSNGVFNTREKDGGNAGVTLKQKIWDFEKTSSKIASLPTRCSKTLRGAFPLRKPGIFTLAANFVKALSTAFFRSACGTSISSTIWWLSIFSAVTFIV